MRNILLFFMSLLSMFSLNSQTLVWSEPIEVADGFGNLRPRLALTNGDYPAIVWGGGNGTQPVYVSHWDGSTFNTPLAVSPSGINPYCASWTGPDIAAVGNDVWVVYDAEVQGDFRVYIVKSSDGGATFSDTVNVGGYSGLSRFAAIGVAEFANPVVAFMDHDPGYADPRYMVSTSSDAGNTWQTPVDGSNSVTGDEVCDCCPPEIVTDGLNQMLMFRNNDANLRDMWATVSHDGGESFLSGSDVDEGNWIISACPSTGPDGFIRGDSVIMTWTTGGYGFPNKVMLTSVSKETGEGRANQVIYPFNTSNQNYPRIHGGEDVFGVVYQESVNGNTDCFLAYSTNGTADLEYTNITINENLEGSQINPDVIFSNGVFHFTWQDNQTGNVIYRYALLNEVGINERPEIGFDIYPNPAHDILHINLNDSEQIKEIILFNQHNIIVKSISLGFGFYNYKIDISTLSSGFYFVKIKTKNGYMTRKFLKIG